MRIGIEVQNMFRPKKHGMDFVILEVLKELQQTVSKHEFFLYAQPNKDTTTLTVKENIHLQLPGPASYHTWEQRLLPQAIKENGLSLLHCTCNTAPISLKVPLVVTIHDIIYSEKCMVRQGSWYQRFGHLYRRWNVPRIAKMAELVITGSDYERQRIIEGLKISSEKVKTIYNPCGKHFTTQRNEKELTTFKLKHQLPDRFVLFFGNTGPKKNLSNVMRALNVLYKRGQLDFTVVMPGISIAQLHYILQEQGNEHLLNHIKVIGYISNDELPNLYRLAELFLYPSLSESSGIRILEAMACGTPVITSNIAAMPEVAGKGALLIDPRKPDEIADMITLVLNSGVTRENAIAYGIERTALFSWEKTASEVVKVYESFAV